MNTTQINFKEVDLTVDYDFSPEEPTIWRYPDGGGHPGSPAYVDIQDILIGDVSIIDIFDEDLFVELEEIILNEHS